MAAWGGGALRRLATRIGTPCFGPVPMLCLTSCSAPATSRSQRVTIVTRWDLEVAGAEQDVRHNIGTGPKHGVPMRVARRRSAPPPHAAMEAAAAPADASR